MNKVSKAVGAVLCSLVLSGLTIACGGSSASGAPVGDDSADFTGSKLSVNEQKSAQLDENGVCRTTCTSANGGTLSDCRAGLFADPAFCSQDDNMCKQAKADENTVC